jgi:hypothetical protein
MINGQYSSWFSVKRGCRQGDPCSPYLYLICAEILSIMIRSNKNIKGIQFKDKENLLSQFADDTTLCLDGSKKSFNEAVKVLLKFAEMSGLKINFDKSHVIWIGSSKNCKLRFMRDKNFIWDPGTFKILGVLFSTDISNITSLNFDNKLLEMKRVLSYWKKRQLTPFGKITVIKTLVFSKIIHLLMNLPDPPEEFLLALEKELYMFIWNGKHSRVKKSVVCKSYTDGGLNMLDVKSFLSSMKISWLRRLSLDSEWKSFTINMYPDLQNLEYFGGEYANVAMNSIKNLFWKDVLKHYKKFTLKCCPINLAEFMSECLYYNLNIVRDRRTIFVKEWFENNIFLIRHLVNEEGQLMSYDQFLRKYPTVTRTNFLMYAGILRAVKQFQRKCNIEFNNQYIFADNTVWGYIKKGNKHVKSVFACNGTVPAAIPKCNSIYENLNWKAIFSHCFKLTRDVQLRWFQYRLLHRLLPTQKYLYTVKIADSPICNFCETDNQTIEHMLYDCTVVSDFWNNFQQLVRDKCQHCHNFNVNKHLILFGVKEGVRSDAVIDFIMLLAKFYVYKCKLQNVLPFLRHFLLYLKQRYN